MSGPWGLTLEGSWEGCSWLEVRSYMGTYLSIFVAGHPLPLPKRVQFPWHVPWELMWQAWSEKVYTWFSHYLNRPYKCLGTQFPLAWVLCMAWFPIHLNVLRAWEVSAMLFPIKYSQISFKILLSFAVFVPPIFTKWDRAVTLSICRWTDFGFLPYKMTLSPICLLSFQKHLCGVVLPPCSTDPLLSAPGSVPPNLPILLHPTGFWIL